MPSDTPSPARLADAVTRAKESGTIEALRAENATLRAEVTAMREALTPSGDTKAVYIGEFSWEEDSDDWRGIATRVVPWTTVKKIMAAIRARAEAARQEPRP